jgi:hypothetical protein
MGGTNGMAVWALGELDRVAAHHVTVRLVPQHEKG